MDDAFYAILSDSLSGNALRKIIGVCFEGRWRKIDSPERIGDMSETRAICLIDYKDCLAPGSEGREIVEKLLSKTIATIGPNLTGYFNIAFLLSPENLKGSEFDLTWRYAYKRVHSELQNTLMGRREIEIMIDTFAMPLSKLEYINEKDLNIFESAKSKATKNNKGYKPNREIGLLIRRLKEVRYQYQIKYAEACNEKNH